MTTFKIIQGRKLKSVRGELAGTYFGLDFRVGRGWIITHLPTGCVLTDAEFLTQADAVYFVSIAEQTFGDKLSSPLRSVIRDNLDLPGGKAFDLLRCYIENIERAVTKRDVDERVNRILQLGESKGVHLRGEGTVEAGLSQ